MSSPLFDLISRAGNASLDELNARSSLTPYVFALELATMLRNGDVTLSKDTKDTDVPAEESAAFEEAAHQSEALTEVIRRIDTPRKLLELAETNPELFVQGIEFAVRDGRTAGAINVNPTSKGFKSVVG
jgi:hypothetical protein